MIESNSFFFSGKRKFQKFEASTSIFCTDIENSITGIISYEAFSNYMKYQFDNFDVINNKLLGFKTIYIDFDTKKVYSDKSNNTLTERDYFIKNNLNKDKASKEYFSSEYNMNSAIGSRNNISKKFGLLSKV